MFTALLKQFDPQLSAHSVKRGAITYLLQLALTQDIPLHVIARLAKHSHQQSDPVPETTLRYGQNDITIARLLKTHIATQYL